VRAGRFPITSIGRATVADLTRHGTTGRGSTALAVAISIATALLIASCTGADQQAAPLEGSEPGAEALDPTATPPARSGDLGQEDLPVPEDLGDGWAYRVDLGNPEDGYVGSGEPATARDPAGVLAAMTPLGCQTVELPMPQRALEVAYERDGRVPGVALVLQFADEGSAASFFKTHAAVIRDCVGARRIDVRVELDVDDPPRFISTRTEQLGETPSWVEGMTVAGDEVRLIAVADPTQRGIDSVTAAITDI
jgi:hypothetical protein